MADTDRDAVAVSQRDYPFYKGWPVDIPALKWLVPLASVALASAILLGQLTIFSNGYLQLVPGLLLALLPMLGLALVAGRHCTALFRRVRLKDIGWMFGFAVLNYALAVPLGYFSMRYIQTEPNAAIAGLGDLETAAKVQFFVNSIPQLIGEELITIVPFLAILYFLTRKLGLSTRSAVIAAWLITAVWFACLHLPTYNWNLLQCLILIGVARLVLTLAYIKTKNVWVSAGAHIINDWATFTLSLVAASAGAG